jgi:threonine dehydrogenase-like Zn-dependent dehydrogenase
MMKAVICRNGRLVFDKVPKPVPKADQVLVRMVNAGFCGSDHSMIVYKYVADGSILGHEVSGTVVDTGSNVDRNLIGSHVNVRPTYCGKCKYCLAGRTTLCNINRVSLGKGEFNGGFAEYLLAYPNMLIPVPEGADSINAAMAEVFSTSLHAVHCTGVTGGSALIMGGGPVGLSMVKILKIKGFGPVVLSEPILEKQHIGGIFGADKVLDPFKDDLRLCAKEITGGDGFDVVFECSGIAGNIQLGIDCAAANGSVSIVSVMPENVSISPMSMNLRREIRLSGSYSSTHEEIGQCLQWMAEGKLDGRPMMTDLITLEELPLIYEERIHTGKATKVMIKIGEGF